MTDKQLVKRILNGEKEVFAQLIDRYKLVVFNLMLRYTGSYETADELTQELFYVLYVKLSKYRNTGSFFSWMYTIAVNLGHDWARKSSVEQQKLAQIISGEVEISFSKLSPFERVEKADTLAKGLATLPEDRRELLILRYCHERPLNELTEIFKLTESGIKMRIHRALKDLQKAMIK